jgi:hypothetical protein
VSTLDPRSPAPQLQHDAASSSSQSALVLTHCRLDERAQRIRARIQHHPGVIGPQPMMTAANIHYEVADRVHGIVHGGIGMIHLLARRVGLIDAIDRNLHLLKRHLPYHESDHVLNIAYNLLLGNSRLQHIELQQYDEVFLDALGAQRIPDPTTAGDFCRRFTEPDVQTLLVTIDEVRLTVWRQQPPEFFRHAILDVDGTLCGTTGEHKEGMSMAYDGTWGYHPLVISLANTGEVLSLVNRPANRPSHEGAAEDLDRAVELCRRAGFASITMRGDTDFSQTEHLDRWHREGTRFVFGIDAMRNLKDRAEDLPESAYVPLVRTIPPGREIQPRKRRPNVKEQIVEEKKYKNMRLVEERVAEFRYRPVACKTTYRVVVLRKEIAVRESGQTQLFKEYQYLFYITNDDTSPAESIVREANGRCHQENLISQLKSGVKALSNPLDPLLANWAYMVMGLLAWTLKAWTGLLIKDPASGTSWPSQAAPVGPAVGTGTSSPSQAAVAGPAVGTGTSSPSQAAVAGPAVGTGTSSPSQAAVTETSSPSQAGPVGPAAGTGMRTSSPSKAGPVAGAGTSSPSQAANAPLVSETRVDGGGNGRLPRDITRSLLDMDMSTFYKELIRIPCQIVRSGGRIVYRLLSWNRWQPVLMHLVSRLHGPLRC